MTKRLVLSYLSLTLLILMALEIPFAITYAGRQQQQAGRQLERDAGTLAGLAEEMIEEHEIDNLAGLAARCARMTHGEVLIVDRQGRLLAAAGPARAAAVLALYRPELRTALTGREVAGIHHSAATHAKVYFVAAPGASGTTIRGAVLLAMPTTALDASVHRMWLILALTGAAVLAAVAFVGAVLARSITRPVHDLERATGRLAGGTLTARAAVGAGPPELRRLAVTFNQTAARLQQLMVAQRNFAADASHQLRTPLTALRLRLENLEPALAATDRRNLDAALTEIDRLARMVDRLLALACMEADGARAEPADLDAAVSARARAWAGPAAAENVTLRCEGEPVGSVLAIPGALEQILDNLLANALRFAPPGSTVTVARRRSGDTIMLHVIDEGPGMTAAQVARAFDRFWRAPDAPAGGSGLGLAIVRRLVEAGGGEIGLRPTPGTGLDTAVLLRTAPAPPDQPRPPLGAGGERRPDRPHADVSKAIG